MIVLGIETSCDETAAAVVSTTTDPVRPWRLLSNVIALVRARMGAIQWLILCGVALVVAIALGTANLAQQFRERRLGRQQFCHFRMLQNSFRSATEHSRKEDISVGDDSHAYSSAMTGIPPRSFPP